MTGHVIQNFRGARALVVHAADPNRTLVETSLRRLGLLVAAVEPAASPVKGADSCDLVFFDADEGLGTVFGSGDPPQTAYVAMIGLETPGRLGRVVRQRCCAHLMKPVKASGVFTAVFLALNEFAARRREAREREGLAQRLAGRRLVTKAVLRMMAEDNIDDDEAYRMLRRESMRRRLPIEEVARQRLVVRAEEAGRLGARSA